MNPLSFAQGLIRPSFAGGQSAPMGYIPPADLLMAPPASTPSLPEITQMPPEFFAGLIPPDAPPALPPAPLQAPAPPMAASAEDQIGTLQDPAVRAGLRDILMELVGNAQSKKDPMADVGRDKWDRFSADILYPLTGFIPNAQEGALQASKDMIKQLDDRKKSRRDAEKQKIDLITDLGKFVREADPDDWQNVIKREQENRLQGQAASMDMARKARAENAIENTQIKREAAAQRKIRDAAYIEHIKNGDENARLRTDQYIKSSEAQIQQRKDDLRERIREANMRNDAAELRLAQSEWKELHREEEDLRDFEMKVFQAADEAKFKTAKANKPKDEPIDYQPPTATEIKGAVGQPKTGAAVEAPKKLQEIDAQLAAIEKKIAAAKSKKKPATAGPKPAKGTALTAKMDLMGG